MSKKDFIKSEFDITKQILIDLENINGTLGLMNNKKFFPSSAVHKSVMKFYKYRQEFVGNKTKQDDNCVDDAFVSIHKRAIK